TLAAKREFKDVFGVGCETDSGRRVDLLLRVGDFEILNTEAKALNNEVTCDQQYKKNIRINHAIYREAKKHGIELSSMLPLDNRLTAMVCHLKKAGGRVFVAGAAADRMITLPKDKGELHKFLEGPSSRILWNYVLMLLSYQEQIRKKLEEIKELSTTCQPKTSNKYYLKSANGRHLKAQSQLGQIYFTGRHVPRDHEKAMEWCLAAANQGDAAGQRHVGLMKGAFFSPFDWLVRFSTLVYEFEVQLVPEPGQRRAVACGARNDSKTGLPTALTSGAQTLGSHSTTPFTSSSSRKRNGTSLARDQYVSVEESDGSDQTVVDSLEGVKSTRADPKKVKTNAMAEMHMEAKVNAKVKVNSKVKASVDSLHSNNGKRVRRDLTSEADPLEEEVDGVDSDDEYYRGYTTDDLYDSDDIPLQDEVQVETKDVRESGSSPQKKKKCQVVMSAY
ncbi:hypothetical protein BGX27_003643, partial [Mortierella sp. AM989]